MRDAVSRSTVEPGNAGESGRHEHAAADLAIMGDVAKIIDFGALSDESVIENAAIDTGIRADGDTVLNHHAPEVGNIDRCRRRRRQRRSPARRSPAPPRIITSSPISAKPIVRHVGADACVRRPMVTPGPITALGPISVPPRQSCTSGPTDDGAGTELHAFFEPCARGRSIAERPA